ncbi:MAG: hypothetical protein ACRDXB_11490 [Actinomycetes bacterium]
MPLGQGIGEMWDAVRDRIEVSGNDQTWHVTAGSFDSALAYASDRFGDPIVLGRRDRNRWWPRVTLTVTTDAALAASAPPLEDIAHPIVPTPETSTADADSTIGESADALPSSLEAIFSHQEERRIARQRTPDHDNVSPERSDSQGAWAVRRRP